MSKPDPTPLPDTRQSVIADAILPPSSTAVRDLTRFCEAYWFPIFANIRRRGYADEAAEDLTQELFAKILDPARNPLANFDPTKGAIRAHGKFRTFMLWQIDGHLSDAKRKAEAEKRGGKLRPVPFDLAEAEARYREIGHENLDPSQLFERLLAIEILDKAEAELEFLYRQSGKQALYHDLKPHLYRPDADESYAQLADRLGLTKKQIQAAIEKMRGDYRVILRKQVAQLCTNPADVENELNALKRAL
jgi:DNA-directed RNA polymerase specialized sigma24 family protein